MTPLRRVVDPLLKSTLVVGDTLRAAAKPKLLAKVVAAFPTDAAGVAGHTDLQGDPIPEPKPGDMWTDGDYNAGRLVA